MPNRIIIIIIIIKYLYFTKAIKVDIIIKIWIKNKIN